MYYSHNLVMSYNADISVVLDLRGYGKTTDFLRWCFDLATRYKKLKFMWLRMRHMEYKECKDTFGASIPKLFPEVMRGYHHRIVKDFVTFERETKKGVERFRGGRIGYIDQFKAMKGTEYGDVDIIVIDELLPEDGMISSGDYDKIMSIMDTVFRLRKPRLVLLSNCVTMANPFFNAWGITRLEEGFTRVKGKNIVIEYGTGKDFAEKRKESAIGKLVSGTQYGDYANSNKFLLDDDTDVLPKPKGSESPVMNIRANGLLIQISRINGLLYMSQGKDKTLKTISPYLDDAKQGRAMFVDKNHYMLKYVTKCYLQGRIVFANQSIKNEIVLIARKIKCGF